jgi:hypothetical protein
MAPTASALLPSLHPASCASLFSFCEINTSLPSGKKRNKSSSLMHKKKVWKKFQFDGPQVCLFGLASINQCLAYVRFSQRRGSGLIAPLQSVYEEG